jgi:hypothetical protein
MKSVSRLSTILKKKPGNFRGSKFMSEKYVGMCDA